MNLIERIEGARRFYVDCEFDGHGQQLLSMALVSDDGDSIQIIVTDIEPISDPWVAANVVPLIEHHNAPKVAYVRLFDAGAVLRTFMGEVDCPVIVADSPVDIGRFCAAISTNAAGGWASADYPRMTFEVHNVDCYPTGLDGAIQHNSWWDAMALAAALRAIGDTHDD